MRWRLMGVLLICVTLLLTGCGHETRITRVEKPWGTLQSPAPDQYGGVRLVLVDEYRRPRGLSRFPDGGKSLGVARYVLIYQTGGTLEREVERIDLAPVRRGDFGNMYATRFDWVGPDQLQYRGEYGYFGAERKVFEGTVTVPPLQ
ncbi:MAG: hypothetical protein K0R39_27 [Symbiobacteriaceae bacterium]|jgi:hypothetical protein|nr:hypothetical protein [Symbiobacteriaceae bacterium]